MDLKLLTMVLVSHLISAGLARTVAAQKARSSRRWLMAGLRKMVVAPFGSARLCFGSA